MLSAHRLPPQGCAPGLSSSPSCPSAGNTLPRPLNASCSPMARNSPCPSPCARGALSHGTTPPARQGLRRRPAQGPRAGVRAYSGEETRATGRERAREMRCGHRVEGLSPPSAINRQLAAAPISHLTPSLFSQSASQSQQMLRLPQPLSLNSFFVLRCLTSPHIQPKIALTFARSSPGTQQLTSIPCAHPALA